MDTINLLTLIPAIAAYVAFCVLVMGVNHGSSDGSSDD